ncbi:PREDICTED: ATP synthase mitochondrial F1 complex assembly factor 1 [Papilio polytes]|uniref:ATP synthase mitochondrial F1 complex assembly factor 1 n=1 Tax=Papilio polytes TaxID=76194 RepID=UPI000675E6E1|nr:PREDICTED: ATP synthase mitochondrial F1 complex assembly factor 1 [Papilio polytes]XP_013144149.1 PREDICTED: ATP synthase mitochondrial F1 complex assembly factor 1 [Papilio polytes]
MAFKFRYLPHGCILLNKLNLRNIMTSPTKLEKAVEQLQKNPYYEKYADRIASLQKTSPQEFLQRLEKQQKTQQQEKNKKLGAVDTRQFSSVLNPKERVSKDLIVEDKKLEAIFKLDLVAEKDASDIQCIWEEYHKNKEVISATIPLDVYEMVHEKMKDYPTFLFPLPRSEGYEFVMCQCHGHTVHFTPLLAFQVHKENAPECLTMIHYTELSHKGIVLMRGEYDKNVLNGQEAQCLANQFQMYFSGKDLTKQQLLETFNKKPNAFKHMDLITELENISIV